MRKGAPDAVRWINHFYLGFLYPLLSPHPYRGMRERLRWYREREYGSLEENRDLQWKALLRLLRHAYDTTRFYRRRFDEAGVHPSRISSPEDLRRIPPLTREEIREHLNGMTSDSFRPEELQGAATGGTTDTPVPLLRDVGSVREKVAVQLRFQNWAGMFPGDKMFGLWGARIDLPERPTWKWHLRERYLLRRAWAPTSVMTPEVLEKYRQDLVAFRPQVIYAYPTPLAIFCEYLLSSGKPYPRPATAICTAETLLADQRVLIEKGLGCAVFEHYGSREFGIIAGECEQHRGMHLNPFAAFVEQVPVEGGEVENLHELLVTDLLSYGVPLVRYRINDCVVPEPESCPCGSGYPRIGQVTGRTGDVFYLAGGEVVPGVALTNRVIKVCPGLKKIQVIQQTLGHFHLRYVPGPTFSESDLEMLRGNLKKFFTSDVQWTFEAVEDIPRERSGKTRFCISHVKRPVVEKKVQA